MMMVVMMMMLSEHLFGYDMTVHQWTFILFTIVIPTKKIIIISIITTINFIYIIISQERYFKHLPLSATFDPTMVDRMQSLYQTLFNDSLSMHYDSLRIVAGSIFWVSSNHVIMIVIIVIITLTLIIIAIINFIIVIFIYFIIIINSTVYKESLTYHHHHHRNHKYEPPPSSLWITTVISITT